MAFTNVGNMGFRDNIYIERFWRTYKYECIYLREINTLKALKRLQKNGLAITIAIGYIKV